MKVLKYILGIIAFLVIGFFLIGLIKSEISYDCEIIVDKPTAESWEVTQDVDKMKLWLDGFQRMEHISGTPGTVGAVSDVYFINDGEEAVVRETVTEIVPNESFSMLFSSDFFDMDYQFIIEDIDGKSKITSHSVCRGNGAISKSMVAIMGSLFKTHEESNLSNLKRVIEEN